MPFQTDCVFTLIQGIHSFLIKCYLFLRTSFTSFTTDMFAYIADTFALVRFRQAVAADFSSEFADDFVISTGNGDLRSARAFDGDAGRSVEFEGMGEAKSQGKFSCLSSELCNQHQRFPILF